MISVSHSDEFDDDDDGSDDDEEKEEVGFAVISFQEKGLRSYFRPVGNPSGDRLRTSASSAHVIILETFKSLLCTEAEGRVPYRVAVLQFEAAQSWGRHLQAIDPGEISEEETASVVESIYNILSNRGGSIRKMEKGCSQWGSTGLPCVLGDSEEAIQQTLACLRTWAVRVAEMSPSLISNDTVAWMRPLAQTPEALSIKLAEAHVTNWFASNSHAEDDDYHNCFPFAHYALYLGRELPFVQQNEKLSTYFAGRRGSGDASRGAVSEATFLVVSQAFPHINMTAMSYLSIALSLSYRNMMEPCLEQLKIAIRHADKDVESMEIYTEMAKIYLMFARRTSPDDNEVGTRSVQAHDMISEGGDNPESEACGGNEWTGKALEVVSKAEIVASSLPESAMEDQNIRLVVRSVWAYKAEVELLIEDSANTLAYTRKVMQACRNGPRSLMLSRS